MVWSLANISHDTCINYDFNAGFFKVLSAYSLKTPPLTDASVSLIPQICRFVVVS